MNQQEYGQEGQQLSTADMVARSEERNGTATSTEQLERANGSTNGSMSGNGNGNGNGNGAQMTDTSTAQSSSSEDGSQEPLFAASDAESLRSRWQDVQTQFVDEPRRSVEQADSMVAELMQRLAKMFADERGGLEQQWDRGGEVSTEDLRQALRRYRSFFERLLSV
jgi:hypothetical protein